MHNNITTDVIKNELSSIEAMASLRGDLRSGNLYGGVISYLRPIYQSDITTQQKKMIENEVLSFTTKHPFRGGGGYQHLMDELQS